jgi:hypothetical protein
MILVAIIEVPRLNSLEIAMALQDKGFTDRRRINLQDARVIFTVKEHLSDDESLIRVQKDTVRGGVEIIDAEKGEILISLTPGDLALPASDYYYDVFVIRGEYAHSSEPDIFRVKHTVLGALP